MDRKRDQRHQSPVDVQAGTITSLVYKGSDGERCGLYLDGRMAFEVAALLVAKAGLQRGDFLTVEQQADLLREDEPDRARRAALSMLARRARCRLEVQTKLQRSGFSPDSVEHTMAWLEAQGYVDDRHYAAAYAAEKLRNGWGRRRILAELNRRGIPRTLVEEEVWVGVGNGAGARQSEAALLSLLERRFGRQLEVDPEGARRRIGSFLARRGHDWDEISRITELLCAGSARDQE